MSIDALIDAFVARLAPEALAKLPIWIRPIASKILDAFYALDFDRELKRLIDEWLKGDRSEPLVMFAMKRHPKSTIDWGSATDGSLMAEGGTRDIATVLFFIQLAIRIFSLLKTEPVMGTAEEAGEFVVAHCVVSDDAELEQAFEQALAA